MRPQVTGFFDEATNTITYVVAEPDGDRCAIVDPVLDYDPKSGRTSTKSADKLVEFLRVEKLKVEWILETHAHADHLTAAPYLREKVGGKTAIGEHIRTVQATFAKVFNLEPGFRSDGSQFDHLFKDGETFSIGGLKEEQIVRIEAPRNLSDTIAYGVTFERGTRVRFGDRSHLFLSGTASIDKTGATIHICDIRKQVERTFDNIEALWETQGATLDDMQYLTLYLRNPKHYPFIQDILAERLRETMPVIAVYAPVCRPNWLFEVDGLAIIPDKTAFPPLD